MIRYLPVTSEILYEQIVGQIATRIVSGDLKVGDQLPPEHELAEQFAVSRTAVREAVKILREKGLIEIRTGRGTFVVNSTPVVLRQSIFPFPATIASWMAPAGRSSWTSFPT